MKMYTITDDQKNALLMLIRSTKVDKENEFHFKVARDLQEFYDEIKSIPELSKRNTEIEKLRTAASEFLQESIVLSDEYLSSFSDLNDNQSLFGWEIKQWRRIAITAKKLREILGGDND
jgi:hypothetical protein